MRRIALAIAFLATGPAAAEAAEFNVDTTADGLGNCAVAGQCTLRQALQSSNQTPERDLVRVPAGTYELTGQDLIVTMNDQVDVVGADPRTTILKEVAGGDGRVFLLEDKSAMALSNVTLTGATAGSAVLLFGNGIDFRAVNVAFTGNTAKNGGAVDGTGGSVTLENSTVAGNTATEKGGGIYLGGAASSLALVNSTVSGNTAPSGSGVYVDAGTATLTHATVADEVFSDAGATPGTTRLGGSIVAACAGGPPVSLGSNLSPGATCALGAAGDRPGADPQLGPLQDNGGLTATRAPAPGSPVLDAAAGCPPPAADQRGVARPQGPACDIGAVEVAVAPPPGPSAAPAMSGLRFTPATFRAAARGAAFASGGEAVLAARRPVGSRLRLRLDQAATVRFTLRRKRPGRRAGRSCVAPTRRNRRARRCTRLVAVRGAYQRALPAGSRALRFRGRWKGRRLAPGLYRLTAVPRQQGRVGRPRHADFRIVR
jgi:parallel beta-helix repeat protein